MAVLRGSAHLLAMMGRRGGSGGWRGDGCRAISYHIHDKLTSVCVWKGNRVSTGENWFFFLVNAVISWFCKVPESLYGGTP